MPPRAGLHCVVCGGLGPFLPTLGILLRCPECNLIFANPRLTDAEIQQLYGSSYFSGDEYVDYIGDRAAIQSSFRPKITYMTRMAPQIERVFEIGAAYGFFLDLARERWDVAGIDISEEAATYAQNHLGLSVCHGDLLVTPLRASYYDAFCMWDTIEHLARPDTYIQRIAELIKPGGYLFISTGDIGSPLARVQGRAWRLIHPPTHLFYFSRITLTRLLEQYGFRVKAITTTGMYRSLRQTIYSLFVLRYPRWRILYDWLITTPLGTLSFYLNLGDIMLVVGQARDDLSDTQRSGSK